MVTLNPDFWQNHFDQNHTPWDRGTVSPQLLTWLDERALTPCRIAVPGCGTGWEVAELASRGFSTTGIDYTEAAADKTRQLLQQRHLQADVIQADVLTYLPAAAFDAIYEQTCLCALDPEHWFRYAAQLQNWLRPGGRLYILFMQAERPGAKLGLKQGPPFHCDITAMYALFRQEYWRWPDTQPEVNPHPAGWHELAVVLERR